MKKIASIISLCLLIFVSSNASSQESSDAGKSIHLIFSVLGWQPQDTIEIRYPERVSTAQMQADMAALAQIHSWKYFENTLEISQEDDKQVAWQHGMLSEKRHLAAEFTLNLQAVREQFPNTENIVIEIVGKNGIVYEDTFTPSADANGDFELDYQKWRNHFVFHKSWGGISYYRNRYTFHLAQISETINLPILTVTASFSHKWFLRIIPLLVFLMLVPGATLYLFLRRGMSRNERGKIKGTPIQTVILILEFHIGMGVPLHLGGAEVCSALMQNAILGFIFGVASIGVASFLIFMRILHQYEKTARGTTWSFRENLLTNLRMIVLGAPALLLPFCFLGTQKVFPHLSFFAFGILLLVQYAILTVLFACIVPFALGWVWKGKPLEDDTIRQRLQELAQKAGIDYRDIVLLQTKNSKLANAWVAGIFPKWRSIFITDYLLEHLKHEELETIFAHELGHLKHRHLLKQVAWIVLGFGGQLLLARLSLFLLSFLTGIPRGYIGFHLCLSISVCSCFWCSLA